MLYNCAQKNPWKEKYATVLILQMILKKKEKKGETKVHYSLIKYNQKGTYNILKDISENVTLVQLMDSLGNVNHAISVVGY